jgi:hypothetical protein
LDNTPKWDVIQTCLIPCSTTQVGAISMKRRSIIVCLFPMLVLLGCAAPQQTKLLPGVTYYGGPEKLNGTLTFLLQHDSRQETNAASSASVYEFDLASKALRKVVDAPMGLFIPSREGGGFCVVDQPGNWFRSRATNAFVFSKSCGLSRTVTLHSEPQLVALSAQHAFFVMKGYGFANPGYFLTTNGAAVETKLIDFDLVGNQMHPVELAGASQWQYEGYDRIHVPRGQPNTLHFYYSGVGKRLAAGKDYRSGFYSMNIQTRKVEWFGELTEDKDDDAYTFRAFDGRYVFFKGAPGSEAPIGGFTLVSSPWDDWHTRELHPKDQAVKVIRSFSELAAFGRGSYVLHSISPDGRFAFVSFDEASVSKAEGESGWTRTYYAVDVFTGDLRKLLKTDVEHETYGSISGVWWVKGSE